MDPFNRLMATKSKKPKRGQKKYQFRQNDDDNPVIRRLKGNNANVVMVKLPYMPSPS